MRRLFWLSVGAGAGIYASHRVKRRVERFARAWSPGGVAARAVSTGQGAGGRLRLFAADVRTEMHAREKELREAVRMDQAPPEPGAHRPRRVLRARYTIIDDDKDGH
ncbi:hypothetical protein AGRA3207_000725 [Actinomadura graeca]|uniref:Secreted protein n=1 Tax=Actinomadura graeca TaxID=2750812 RepID=A0ABX8QQ69_9ACTN|nr:hypothetical protein [Actinomadura graeca]QXJ20079.1 hypothetical protein AGRA3207_000725 [Actinomadura graeca]